MAREILDIRASGGRGRDVRGHSRYGIRLGRSQWLRVMVPAMPLALGLLAFQRFAAAGRTAEPRERGAIAVEQRFEHPLADGCRYEATLHGSLRRIAASPRSPDPERLVPDLSIEAEVHCGRSTSQQPTVRTLASGAMTVPQLLEALGNRGAIVGVSRGRVCTFTPEFALDGMRFRQVNLRESCERPTFGGGPRDRDWRDWR